SERLAIWRRAIIESYATDEWPIARVGSNRIQSRMDAQQAESRRLFLHGNLQPAIRLVDVAKARVERADSPRRHHTLLTRRPELVEHAPRCGDVARRRLEMRKPE